MGLDDEELDRFLLTEDEVRIKERVWVELNKDYLEAIAGMFFTPCPRCLVDNAGVAKGERETATTAKSNKVRTMVGPKIIISFT